MQDNDQLPSQSQNFPPPAQQKDVAWTDVQMNSLRFYRDYDNEYEQQSSQPEPPKKEFGMRDVLYAIFRHPLLILFCIVFISFGAYVYVVIQPNVYKSEARVLVNFSVFATMLDPASSSGSMLGMSKPPLDLRTEIGIIKSQALAELVVDDLGPEKILVNMTTPESSKLKTWLKRQLNFAEKHYTPRDRAIQKVMDNLIASISMGGSAVLVIEYLDGSPERAQLVLNKLVELYEKEHIRLNSVRMKPEYFQEKALELKIKLEKSEAEIAALLKEHNVTAIDVQKEILLEQIAANETEKLNLIATVNGYKSSVALLKEQLDDMEKLALAQPASVTPPMNRGQNGQEILSQLTQLQLEESSLMEIYTDQHPKLIAVRSKIARLKLLLPTPATNEETGKTDPLPALKASDAYRTLKMQYDTAVASLANGNKKIESLNTQHAQLTSDLAGIGGIENEIKIRQRDHDLLQSNYQMFSKSQAQANVAAVLAANDVSNIQISQQAIRPIEPLKSARKMFAVLVMGVLGSVFVGIGLAVALEFVSQTMKTNEEVEHALGTPVLITVPRQRYHLLPNREVESE